MTTATTGPVQGQVSRDKAKRTMRLIDEATKRALAEAGLEAFRFDAEYSPTEGWMRVKIKIRPVGRATK